MAYKLKWYLDTRKLDKDGKGRLYMAVYNLGSTGMIPTGVALMRGEFANGRVVKVPLADKLTKMLKEKMVRVQLAIEELALNVDVDSMKGVDLKRAALKYLTNNLKQTNGKGWGQTGTFEKFANRFVARIKNERTKGVYEFTVKKVGKFCDIESLTFEDIDVGWLKDFEAWMEETCGVNARGIHLRNVRALFNAAIDEGVVGAEVYPFRRFKIKKEETMKRSLTVQDLRRLRDYPCEKWQRVYVDMFMLSFYLCGINMVDLVALPKIKRGSLIEFRRSKTGVPCRMKVPDVAWEIIDRYGGRDRLVSFGEDCCSVEAWHNRLHRMNMALQKIGPSSYTYVKAKGRGRNMKRKKVYVSLFPELTSYWARHTWATLAAEMDVPDAVIDAALGHRSPYPMADIYIRRNYKKVDEAVDKVIAYLNNKDNVG